MVVEFYKLLMSFDFFFFNYVSFRLHIYVVSNSPLEVDKVWLEKEDGKVSTKNIVVKEVQGNGLPYSSCFSKLLF